MSTGIVARAKSALKMDPMQQQQPKSSSTGPIHLNTSSVTKKSSSSSSVNPAKTVTSSKTAASKKTSSTSEVSSGVKKTPGRHHHQPHEGQSLSSPITTTSTSRPSRRVTASSGRVSIQQPASSVEKKASTSTVKKRPSTTVKKEPSVSSKPVMASSKKASEATNTVMTAATLLKEDSKKRDESPSSTHVNVSSDECSSPNIVEDEAAKAEELASEAKKAMRTNTRDMVSPVSSPNMSDLSDNESTDNDLLSKNSRSTKVKRSESDGIVMQAERPKQEKLPVRRCESTDDATKDRLMPTIDEVPSNSQGNFPGNIKTVASATIVKGPEDQTHKIGDTLHFSAHYFGNPEPRVVWIKNGQKLNTDQDRTSIKTYSGESTLIVRDLRGDDSGKYEIQIENEVGNDAATASLNVEGPPEPPAGRPYVSHIDSETSSLTLAWYGSTFDGGSMVTGYVVEMSCWPITSSRQPPDASDWLILNEISMMSTSFVVTKLDKDKEYIFRVKAVNAQGQSQPSKVSEPVSLEQSNQVSGSSGNEDNADEETKDDSTESNEGGDLDAEEPFEAPFEHRIVQVEDGSIFKSKYEIYEELGRGRFGVVFKVKDKINGEILAAKFVRCRKSEEKQKCKDEIAIMNVLDSCKLLQLAAAYENPREIIMVMEYIGGGELFEKVVADDFTLTERDCVLFMRQICEAVGYMHEKSIVHLDLKPENILCKSKTSHLIKIIDFGLTKKLKQGEDVRILFGTPEFVSPEVISYEPVSTTSDMWSVGVICYVLLSGLSPFMGDSDVETFANISGIAYDFDDEAFDNISDEAKDFISKLLVKFQNKRLTAAGCLLHPWLTLQVGQTGKIGQEINTDKLKSFLMRRRWQKAAHAIRALGRFTSLGYSKDAKDGASTITALSTQSADF